MLYLPFVCLFVRLVDGVFACLLVGFLVFTSYLLIVVIHRDGEIGLPVSGRTPRSRRRAADLITGTVR